MTTLEEWSCLPESLAALEDVASNAGPLFTLAVQALLAAQCALVRPENNPMDRTEEILTGNTEFDFIIVGAGSAGSVLANRLTEIKSWNVLLIEAGGDPGLSNIMPIIFFQNLNTTVDWKYITEPSNKACLGSKDRRCRWPRGKVLGGSSAINAMFYIRGNKRDYDEWKEQGNDGWSYENVLKYFKKSENYNGDDGYYKKNEFYHGKDGYLNVEKFKIDEYLSDIIITAQNELGVEDIYEHNGHKQIGISKGFATIKNGRRVSAANAFLNPIKDRKNLWVLKNTEVKKITFDTNYKKVTGVEATLSNGNKIKLKASKEVVLSAGSINTPHLLLLSGLGPKTHLEQLGINVVNDLPVGENLQDHITVPVLFEVKPGQLKKMPDKDIGLAYAQYYINEKSVLGTLLSGEVVQFIDTKNGTNDIPDIQYHYIPLHINDTFLFEAFFKGMGFTDELFESVAKINRKNCLFMVLTTLLKPYSQGKILLNAKNIEGPPLIFSNYFENEKDLQTIIKGIEILEKISDTDTFKKEHINYIKTDYSPCKKYKLRTDDYRKCFAQHYGFTLFHPTSTAKMGPKSDKTSVVDSRLKVHGVKGLRVADASIMPSVIRGNTNAPSIMIGEKASDLIKEDWIESKDEL